MKKSIPKYLWLHISTVCNLRCPYCIQKFGSEKVEEYCGGNQPFLNFKIFQNLIDEIAPYGQTLVILFGTGEPMMHPHFYDMAEYAYENGLHVQFDTNGHFMEEPERLARIPNLIMHFCLDGFTQDSYEKYRRKGSIDVVKKNLTALSKEIARQPFSSRPRLIVKYLVNRYTENHIEEARNFCQNIDVEFMPSAFFIPMTSYEDFFVNRYATTPELYTEWAPINHPEFNLYFLDESKNQYLQKMYFAEIDGQCEHIDDSMIIFPSGNAHICCDLLVQRPWRGYLGNVYNETIIHLFNKKEARYFRERYHKNKGHINECSNCSSNRTRNYNHIANLSRKL